MLVGLFLTNAVQVSFTVQVDSMDYIRAINDSFIGEGVDYSSGPYNATFSAGSTTTTFAISIFNDDRHENLQTLSLKISEDSLPTCTFVRNAFFPRTTVTIIDDDRK